MITDRQVQKAIREAPGSGKKAIELKDPGERGSGRLAMIVRPFGAFVGRVTAEWYAVYYVAGARKTAKLGSYPVMGVAEARRAYSLDWAPKIAAGEDPAVARRQAVAGTLGELRDAYVASLRAEGKRVANLVEGYLKPVVDDIGAGKLACPGPMLPQPPNFPWRAVV